MNTTNAWMAALLVACASAAHAPTERNVKQEPIGVMCDV